MLEMKRRLHEGEDECGCGHHHDHEHHHDDEHDHHEHHHHHDDDDDDDECGCGCGCHDDDDECEHDHEHHEHHHHHHDGDDDDECGCGCGHHHHHDDDHGHHHEAKHVDGNVTKKVYILEHLGCANCAAKMESKINALPDVADAVIVFATKQLRLEAKDPDALLPEIQKICASIESEVIVTERKKSASATTKTYILENLGCANCAAKMESRINDIEGIEEATITFATKQLRVTAKNPDAYKDQMQKICASIESEVVLKEKERTVAHRESVQQDNESKKSNKLSENAKSLIGIITGTALFAAGVIISHTSLSNGVSEAIIFVIAYLILGGEVVLTAIKNLFKGQVFDENFLMSIATLGAFAIKEFPEAVGVMLFYRIGEFFEHVAVERSRSQIMDAVDMRPEVVNLVNGDDVQVIPAEDAHVGDILLVRAGDRIPLDGVVVEGESRIDTSPVTGEPVPVQVAEGSELISGCVNTNGVLKIRVEKVLEESMVTRILDSVENAAASKPKIDRFITRFARIYTPVVVAIAVATAVIPSLVSGNWNYWIYTALSFLVMSCPCALVLSVPLAFFSAIGAGSKRGILFKGGVSVEAMSNVEAIVMDKTGTITKGNFVVQNVVPDKNTDVTEDALLRMSAVCELSSTHPIAVSIVEAAKAKGIEVERPISQEEIAGHGIKAVLTEGEILCGNRKLMDMYHVDLSQYKPKKFGTEVLLAKDGQFIGHIVIADTLKPDAASAIAALKRMNKTTAMLTGDGEESAQSVAKEVGIDEVYAKLLPQDKLQKLQDVRNAHGAVMFVGDGINDAPVLAGADVGAAMGSGADAAIEAADVVFMTSEVSAIPQSLTIAKRATRIAWQNVIFALIIKVAVMILGLCGFASMWLAVFADTGVAMLCILNSIRILYSRLK